MFNVILPFNEFLPPHILLLFVVTSFVILSHNKKAPLRIFRERSTKERLPSMSARQALVLSADHTMRGLRLEVDENHPGSRWKFLYYRAIRANPRSIGKGPRARVYDHILIRFPPMHVPCDARRSICPHALIQELTVDFKNEEKCLRLQNLRIIFTRLQAQVQRLLAQMDSDSDTHLTEGRMNLLIRPGKMTSHGKSPDQVRFKVQPGGQRFYNPRGLVLNTKNIDFTQFDIEPTVKVQGVQKVGDLYFPRLVLQSCILHPRQVSLYDALGDLSEDSDTELESDNDENQFSC